LAYYQQTVAVFQAAFCTGVSQQSGVQWMIAREGTIALQGGTYRR